MHSKSPGDLVTSADFASERAVLAVLERAYPQDGVLSEESEAHGNPDSCWVLDPLDGTTNFVHNQPDYCLALAYCRDGTPEIGVIYDICRDDIYTAERGRGARCNGNTIRISPRSKLAEALVAMAGSSGAGSRYWEAVGDAVKRTAGMRRTGSAALDLALVARGSIDAAVCRGLQYWDYAAGAVLIAEAGGQFSPLADEKAKPQFGRRVADFVCGSTRMTGGLRRQIAAHLASARQPAGK